MEKMSLTDCLFGLAEIDSQQKRRARGGDLEFCKKVEDEAKKLVTEFYKKFNEVDFVEALKKALKS